MLQKAYFSVEALVARAVEILTASRPDLRKEALRRIAPGKKRLTLGEYIKIIEVLDSERQLVPGQKVVSKADNALLNHLSASRNNFIHPGSAKHDTETRSRLEHVARVCTLPLIEAAIHREADEVGNGSDSVD